MINVAADPELFVRDSLGNVSSIAGILGLSKEKRAVYDGFRIQEDNVLLEFDIDPCDNFSLFDKYLHDSENECNLLANKFGYQVDKSIQSHVFKRIEIESFHPKALEFGCDPDYNALTGARYARQRVSPGLRTAGGHIHIGWSHKPITMSTQSRVGIMCDYFLGLPSVLMDDDTERKKLYGKAGCIRYKPYGIEYRTLSNFWVNKHNRFIWDQANKACNTAFTETFESMLSTVDPFTVQKAIDSGDKLSCEKIMREVGVE